MIKRMLKILKTLNSKKTINSLTKDAFLEYDFGFSVRAFSTTRNGGISEGSYSSFNINNYNGDSLEHVLENRRLLCEYLSIDDDHLILPNQTHTNNVVNLSEDFFHWSYTIQQSYLKNVDAIITSEKKVCIGISTVDCVPLLFYDKSKSVIAAVHAGWRGTVNKIVLKTIDKLYQDYGCNSEDIVVEMGPSISQKAFEVDSVVYNFFIEAHFEMPLLAIKKKDKWYIDLCEANRQLLLSVGILEKNIKVSSICTYYNDDRFFSARRLGIHSGRMFTGILMDFI